jgi:DNA-binding CsgD family transcriptional regulator
MRKTTYSRAYFPVFDRRRRLGELTDVLYRGSMVALSLYTSIVVLLMSTSATTLCFACYGLFRHRAAFWLSMCMAGLSLFGLTDLVLQVMNAAARAGPGTGIRGLDLVWQAMGSIMIAHALPRFLLSAFGGKPRKLTYRLLDAATAVVAALSALRVVTGWNDLSAVPALPNSVLRIFLLTLIGGSLALTLVYQSRLPDRSLYKAVIVQTGALTLLFPFVVLEDLGLLAVSGFPFLAGKVLLAATAVAASVHARKSLMRPKYVADKAPSSYFVEHFGISGREIEIVTGVMEGLSNNTIAERLFISPRTVEKHLYNIYQKAGIKNRLQLFNLLRSDTL